MKTALLFIFIISSFAAFSQNWAPINSTEKFCYSSDDNLNIINNVLWVDSVEQSGNDQIYHLNKIARLVEDQNFDYLFNEPQFLLDDVIVQENGVWLFIDTSFNSLDTLSSFSLFPNGQLYDSWEFSDGINAAIANISTLEIFGEIDSVKTILLSDLSMITLSKNYGIINWRNLFRLVGVEGRNLGLLVPNFDNMYANISAGDVVCLEVYGWETDGNLVQKYIKRRYDFESVIRYEDSIVANAYIRTDIHYVHWGESITEIEDGNQDIVFRRNTLTDAYPNEVLFLSIWENYAWGSGYAIAKLDEFKWGGLKKTQIDYEGWWPNSSLLYRCGGPYHYELCEKYDETLLMEQSVKYGFLEYDNNGFEWGGHKILKGVIDNGDTLGYIYPLEIFVGTNQLSSNSNWLVYPNPVQEDLYIKSSQSGLIIWSIFNISGQIISQGTLEKTKEDIKLSVADLPKGIFILQIELDGEVTREKFFKTQ